MVDTREHAGFDWLFLVAAGATGVFLI